MAMYKSDVIGLWADSIIYFNFWLDILLEFNWEFDLWMNIGPVKNLMNGGEWKN